MPGINANKEKYLNWNFSVEIGGFDVALFTKAKLPTITVSKAEFNRAGSMFPEKHPSRVSFDDVELEKGVFDDGADKAAYDWITKVVDAGSHTRLPLSAVKKEVHIVQYDASGNETRRWILHNAWISKYEAGEVDASSEAQLIEKLTITYEYATMA